MTVPTLELPGTDQIRRWQAASRGLAQRAATIRRALAAATTTVFDSRVRLDVAPSGAILQVGIHGTARLSGSQLAQRVIDLYQRALAFIADGTVQNQGGVTVGLTSEVEPPASSLHRVPSPPLSRPRPSPRSAPRLSPTGFEESLRQRMAAITEYAARREELVRDLVGSYRDDQVECQVDRHDHLLRLVLRGTDNLTDDQLAALVATSYAQARDDVRRQIADVDERHLS